MTNYVIHFLLGMGAAFIGSIPFGPVNLTVVSVVIGRGLRYGLWLALGAALIELAQVWVAVYFFKFFSDQIENNPWFNVLIVGVLLGLALFFIFRKRKTELHEKTFKLPYFIKGFIVGAMNPQAIPFWVFAVMFFSTWKLGDMEFFTFTWFLAGVASGKFLLLSSYAYGSMAISKRFAKWRALTDKVIGTILIGLASIHVIRILLKGIDGYFV